MNINFNVTMPSTQADYDLLFGGYTNSRREGAILDNKFLEEIAFKEQLTTILTDHTKAFKNCIQRIIGYINKQDYGAMYKEYEKMQHNLLTNNPTDILFISNYDDGQNTDQISEHAQWSYGQEEVSEGGQITAKIKKLQTQQIAEIVYKHLQGLEQSIEKHTINQTEADYLWDCQRKQQVSVLTKYKNTGNYPTYLDVVYGKFKRDTRRGQIADSFLSHLGLFHSELIRPQKPIKNSLENNSTLHPVEAEEKALSPVGFIKRLNDGLNSTPWMSGGDLILVDSDGKVTANIQLKTTKDKGFGDFNISCQTLLDAFKSILRQLNGQNITEAVNIYYEMVKTSCIEPINKDIMKTINDVLNEQLISAVK